MTEKGTDFGKLRLSMAQVIGALLLVASWGVTAGLIYGEVRATATTTARLAAEFAQLNDKLTNQIESWKDSNRDAAIRFADIERRVGSIESRKDSGQ